MSISTSITMLIIIVKLNYYLLMNSYELAFPGVNSVRILLESRLDIMPTMLSRL
jgi:hypothetical protein